MYKKVIKFIQLTYKNIYTTAVKVAHKQPPDDWRKILADP